MEPLICRECGGAIDAAAIRGSVAVCPHCSANFVLPPPPPFTVTAPPKYAPAQTAPGEKGSKEGSPLLTAAGLLISAVTVIVLLIDLFMPTPKDTRTGINFAANNAKTSANAANTAAAASNSMKALANLLAEMANRAANANATAVPPPPKRPNK